MRLLAALKETAYTGTTTTMTEAELQALLEGYYQKLAPGTKTAEQLTGLAANYHSEVARLDDKLENRYGTGITECTASVSDQPLPSALEVDRFDAEVQRLEGVEAQQQQIIEGLRDEIRLLTLDNGAFGFGNQPPHAAEGNDSFGGFDGEFELDV